MSFFSSKLDQSFGKVYPLTYVIQVTAHHCTSSPTSGSGIPELSTSVFLKKKLDFTIKFDYFNRAYFNICPISCTFFAFIYFYTLFLQFDFFKGFLQPQHCQFYKYTFFAVIHFYTLFLYSFTLLVWSYLFMYCIHYVRSGTILAILRWCAVKKPFKQTNLH